LNKSAAFIVEELPSISTAKAKPSPRKTFVDGRHVAVNM
jgi:hypothetical protein